MATVKLADLPELAPEDLRDDDILLVQRSAEAEPDAAQRTKKLSIGFLIGGTSKPAGSSDKPAASTVPFTTVAADGSGDYKTIEAAILGEPPGVTIFIKRGVYSPEYSLAPKANQTLRGEGAGATIILAPVGSGRNCFAISTPDVTVADLEVNGQRLLQPNQLSSAHSGFYVTGARCTIRNVYLHDVRNMGVYAPGADDLSVSGCRLENHATNGTTWGGAYSYKGIYCAGCARPHIQNCTLRGWSQAVGFWYGVVDGVVQGNQILDNYGFEDDARTVSRSAIEDFGAAVAPHGRNRWINNVIDGSTSHCLEIAQGVVGSQFIGNTLRNPGRLSGRGSQFEVTGVVGQITTDILIQGNTIESDGTKSDTCQTVANAYRISIQDNIFQGFTYSGNGGNGALLIGGVAGNRGIDVRGNQFINCRYGVYVLDVLDSVLIESNRFEKMAVWAIYVASGPAHRILSNRIYSTVEGGGIWVLGTAGNGHRIWGNVIDTQATPIDVRAPEVLIEANDLNGLVGAAAGVYTRASRLAIVRNIIRGAAGTERDVWVAAGDYVQVTDNALTYDLVFDNSGGTHNEITRNHVLGA